MLNASRVNFCEIKKIIHVLIKVIVLDQLSPVVHTSAVATSSPTKSQ